MALAAVSIKVVLAGVASSRRRGVGLTRVLSSLVDVRTGCVKSVARFPSYQARGIRLRPVTVADMHRSMISFVAGNAALQEEPPNSDNKAASALSNAAVAKDLEFIQRAMGLDDLCHGEHISIKGKTVTWGISSKWNLTWCTDGCFYERYWNEETTQEWGHDTQNTWYADVGGRVVRLEMDEGEAILLTAWIRTGFWAMEQAWKMLDIQHKEILSASECAFTVRLKNKAVVAQIMVDRNTWLPKSMNIQHRRWDLSSWEKVLPNRAFILPTMSVRASSATTKECFRITGVTIDSCKDESLYTASESVLRPRHKHRYPYAEFDRSGKPYVQMVKSKTGHYIVRPLIDGRDIGCFIVDTGTGTLAITQRKARQLGLSTFGEVHATSISGGQMLTTRFCRGSSFQIGPLKIHDPIFVQIGIDKLLKDADGLCGFDIFHGSIVEMSHVDHMLSLYEPREFQALTRGRHIKWQRMYLYDRVPHVVAKINGREALLMLDTGAAGPGLMFPSSAVHGFDDVPSEDMPAALGRGGTLYVSQADYGNVQHFEIGGCSFQDLTALVPNKSGQQMGLSEYCAGVICAEMLKHFTIFFDYSKRCIAFLDERNRKPNAKC